MSILDSIKDLFVGNNIVYIPTYGKDRETYVDIVCDGISTGPIKVIRRPDVHPMRHFFDTRMLCKNITA